MAGPSVLDKLQRASFSTIEFPCESIEVSGGVRDHVHEFPHSDGGAPEKLGIKLYTVKMRASFLDKLPLYPRLWPDKINALMRLFELQLTAELVVPTLSRPIRAYCTSWTRRMEARLRSGEKMELEFRQDGASDFGDDVIVDVTAPRNIATYSASLQVALTTAPARKSPAVSGDPRSVYDQLRNERERSIFDSIRSLSSTIGSLQDAKDLAGGQMDAKLAQLAQLCHAADKVSLLGTAEAWPVLDALHALWKATVETRLDLAERGTVILTKRTPTVMTIGQVSAWLYSGDATRIEDLLALNRFTRAAAIPAGTLVRYYQ